MGATRARAGRPALLLAAALAALPGSRALAELPDAIHETLPNGMQLVFIEDHSTPLVSVCVRVGVGSADEGGRTSGASHLLEHLLFDGTATRSRAEIQAGFDRIGAYVNAFTRREYTGHILSAPRDLIAQAIELQADMLLASSFPEAEVAKERNVVIEEMKRDRDDPHGWSQELFERALWSGTPLALDPIGTEGSVEGIPRDDIIAFWREHYTPDRMITTVVGDFQPADMRALFERLYGGTAPSAAFGVAGGPAAWPPAAGDTGTRRREEWLPTDETVARFGFRAPAWNDSLAPAMEIAERLLAEGEESRLAKRLSAGPKPVAGVVEGGVTTFGRGSAFTVTMTLADRDQLAAAEGALQNEFRLLAEHGPSREELERVKTAWRVADAFECDNLLYFAMGLADWGARGGYEGRRDFSRRAMAVTGDDVREVVRRWLLPMPALIHVTVPLPEAPAPSPGAAAGGSPVRTERRALPNGLVIVGRENPASRVTAFHALIGHRLALEPDGRAGITNLVLEMLSEGTGSRRAEAIAGELAAIGARLQVSDDPRLPFDDYYWSPDFAYVRLEVANEFAPRARALFDDLLRHASFPADRLPAARQRVAGLIAQEEAGASAVGRLLLRQGLFAGTRWDHPIRGSAASLAAISRDELVNFHREALSPENVILSFAGGAPLAATFAAIEKDWGSAPAVAVHAAPVAPVRLAGNGASAPLQRRMERDQMWIGLTHRAPGANSPSMPALIIAAAVLDRRLGLDLRETQGLAYSIGAGAGFARDFGWVTLSMGTRTANHDRAVQGLRDAIAKIGTGDVTADEMTLARNATVAQRVRYRQRAIGQAYALGLNEYLGLGSDFDAREGAAFAAVSLDDVNRAARENFAGEGWVWAEVGRVVAASSGAGPAPK